MDILQAIVLGLVQGFTEFLPVSSSTHVRLVPTLLGWPDPGASFTAVIQVGTVLAVILYFWKDLVGVLVGWFKSFRDEAYRQTTEVKLGWAILIGTIPIVVLGVLFKDDIETTFRSLYVISFSLIGLALVLGLAEIMGKHTKNLQDVNWRNGLWVGIWQALALVPGMSRSGSTITAGLFAGFDRETAARFSFLMSVPSILGAAIFSLKSHADVLLGEQLVPIVVSNIVAFLSGYAGIAFLMNFLRTHSTLVFIVYRVLLGGILLVLLQSGRLKPF